LPVGQQGRWRYFGINCPLRKSLVNLLKRTLNQLTALVKSRLKCMQYRPSLLEGFIAKTGLDFAHPDLGP
jgi:putative transposase